MTPMAARHPRLAAGTTAPRDGGAALERALERIMSLQDGDQGVLDVVACGQEAIPRLRHLLFRREPSGLYQPRCRVVEALAALGAQDVLRAFVDTDREINDPVERAGEEAVLNTAVRALRGEDDEAFFQRLLELASTRRLAGAIELLGTFRRPEALSCLIAALADDLARMAAEDAIRQYGRAAETALLAGATERIMQDGAETESSRRRRRAALGLLLEISGAAGLSRQQRDAWCLDDDPWIALAGCRLALACGAPAERCAAIRRLLDMLPAVDWQVRRDIEDCLIEHGDDARPLIRAAVPAVAPDATDFSRQAEAQRCLIRLARRIGN
jgi:hypothetical protein